METASFRLRALYLAAFGTSVWAGFMTYRFFVDFQAAAGLNPMMVAVNTVLLLPLWVFTMTKGADFISQNVYLIIIVPLLAIYLSNLYFALNTAGALTSYLWFVASSTILFIASERFGAYEHRLKES